jgi:hypothetical protein
LAARVDLGDRTLKLSDPIVIFTPFRIGHEPYTLGSGGMAAVAGGHSIGAAMRWGVSSVVEMVSPYFGT